MSQKSSSQNQSQRNRATPAYIAVAVVVCMILGGIIALGLYTWIVPQSTPEVPATDSPSASDPSAPPTSDSETSDGLIPFTTSQQFQVSDYDSIIDALFQDCAIKPETLASTMSAFPTALQAVDIEVSEPDELYDLLIGENGSDVQLTLLRTLRFLMESPGVSGWIYHWAESEHQMLYVQLRDATAERTPENTTVVWAPKNLTAKERVLEIVANYDNDVTEAGYFCLTDGFARILPNDGDEQMHGQN